MVSIGVQAEPSGGESWRQLAVNVEASGFDRLLVADHPGATVAPFVALAAAASVTERMELGTYVANAGVWEPLDLAQEVATLHVLSGGRALLGLGAGHTPAEWTMRGVAYPSAGERVDRLIEVADVTMQLLSGQSVTFAGEHVTVEDASLGSLAPGRDEIPLLIGGNGPRLLGHAAQRGARVGMSGLGRTLEDGHRHAVLWSEDDVDARVEIVRRHATGETVPGVDVLVQHVELTDQPMMAAAEIADRVSGLTASDALTTPFLWIGTVDAIVAQLREHRDRWNITSYVVREDAVEDATQVLDAL